MLASDEPFDENGQPNPVVAAMLPTLSPGTLNFEYAEPTVTAWKTGMRWQQDFGSHAHLADLAMTVRSMSVARGRGAEIFGRAASMGEQIAIAATAAADAQRWIEHQEPGARQSIAVRALCDLSVHNALSASHGLINISARVVNLQGASGWSPRDPEKNAYWKGALLAPFERGSWIGLSKDNARDHRRDAAALELPAVSRLAGIVNELVDDPRWRERIPDRNEDFHGWRAQSIDGGVPRENPWSFDEASASIGINGHVMGHQPPDPGQVVKETQAIVAAVTEALDAWHDALPAALKALDLPVIEW